MLEIPTTDGTIPAQGATDPQQPGLLIVPSIFGPDAGTVSLAETLAEQGIGAVVMDPFWRSRPGAVGFSEKAAAKERARALSGEQTLADVVTAAAWLGKRCRGQPAVLGICFGGRYAVMAAAEGVTSTAMAWHGGGLLGVMPQLQRAGCRVSLHFGEDDGMIPVADVAQIRAGVASCRNVRVHLHPGCGHGFTHRGHPNFMSVAANAALADALRILWSLSPLR